MVLDKASQNGLEFIENTKKNAVTWTALDTAGGIDGGAGGNRTRVRKPSTGSSTYLVRSFDF
jgi:hypothetical protein